MKASSQIPSGHDTASRPPGFLLVPFGWAAGRMLALLHQSPELIGELLYISPARVHLIGLALAHTEGGPDPELTHILIRGSAGEILDSVVGRRPIGLKRIFRCLPRGVLEPASYRRLIRLLDDPAAAKMLHHAGTIDDAAIKIIDDVPAEIRTAVFAMQAWFRGMEFLADGLRCLVRRGAAASYDQLIDELSSVRQPDQMIAKIKMIVEALPLPDALPPASVGHARRIDRVAEVRDLAKRWRNCLESYIWRIDGGECAVYLWEHDGIQAACMMRRRGRLGWFLDEIKGPRNTDIEQPHLDLIVEAFDAAGTPPYQQIKAVEDIVDMAGVRGLRRRPRRGAPQLDEVDAGILQGVA
jgi:hypothetical protein